MNVTPSDLHPGQRVRITRCNTVHECTETWEGRVTVAGFSFVVLKGIGNVFFTRNPEVTHNIEVLE